MDSSSEAEANPLISRRDDLRNAKETVLRLGRPSEHVGSVKARRERVRTHDVSRLDDLRGRTDVVGIEFAQLVDEGQEPRKLGTVLGDFGIREREPSEFCDVPHVDPIRWHTVCAVRRVPQSILRACPGPVPIPTKSIL
jgi:hypothetical protein